YLGFKITGSIVTPQKLKIDPHISTLQDVQKLLGDIQWIQNYCGITNSDIAPLVQLLKGGGGVES
ncbi:POK8 protein, partial [Alectura lathami]|nr:POK8 protein [Alectura lathami]NXL96090.1 POK8 protein [Alectura lathami]